MTPYAWFVSSDARAALARQVAKFVVAGGIAALLNFSLLYALTEFLRVWYLLSAVAAAILGMVAAFVLQKFWTFRNNPLDRVHVQLSQHIALSAGNIVLNIAVLYALVQYAGMWYMLAQILITASLAAMNYFVYRLYIFPRRQKTTS